MNMCGICGFTGRSDGALLESMTRALIHRGPDEEGKISGENCSLGVRRLKVIDLDTGSQPIHNEDKSLWIVFNGEIYNFEELKEDLIKKGHSFYTKTDTEVIVHLYEEEGEECLKKLRGMFAFAIWDNKKERLFLARDRLGIKPLYYYRDADRFIFASELRAILRYKKFSKKVDLHALDAYLTYLYIPQEFCIFGGAEKLPAASFLTFEKNRINIERYWYPACGPKIRGSEEEICGILEAKIEEAVKIRLRSDVPLGVFLSGGIDSSTIVAMMSRSLGGGKIKTFSVGYGGEASSYNELRYSRLVSRYFKTEHKEYILTPDLKNIVRDIVYFLDEPFANSSAIPTYLISKMARENVTVALSGTGGDELFAGYPRHLGARISGYYEKMPGFIRECIYRSFYNFIPETIRTRNTGGWLKRFIRGGAKPSCPRYMEWISFFTEEEKGALYSEGMKQNLRGTDSFAAYRRIFDGIESGDFLEKIFYFDLGTYLIDDLLYLSDRMSMANSLELRVPFCDHELAEFALTIPPNLKLKRFRLKYIMKRMLKGILPDDILIKRKQGFMVPLGMWFRKDLNSFAREVLSENEIRKAGYFEPSFIQWMMDEHFSRRKNFTHKLWALIVFHLWHDIFMENA